MPFGGRLFFGIHSLPDEAEESFHGRPFREARLDLCEEILEIVADKGDIPAARPLRPYRRLVQVEFAHELLFHVRKFCREEFLAEILVGQRNVDEFAEAFGERAVEQILAVGVGEDQEMFVLRHAVEVAQEGGNGRFGRLIIAPPRLADLVEFIKKDGDAAVVLLRIVAEKGKDFVDVLARLADEAIDERGNVDEREGLVDLLCNCLGKGRLARSRRAFEQDRLVVEEMIAVSVGVGVMT